MINLSTTIPHLNRIISPNLTSKYHDFESYCRLIEKKFGILSKHISLKLHSKVIEVEREALATKRCHEEMLFLHVVIALTIKDSQGYWRNS